MSAVVENKSPAGKAAWIVLAIAWVCFLVPVPGLGLFLGWPLNLVAFILAIVAMAKGGAMKGLWQLLGSLIASPIVYFIGLAIFSAAVGGSSYKDYKAKAEAAQQSAAPSAQTAPAVDAIEVSALQLYQAYQANEISADAKYKGKPLLIHGTVDSIHSDLTDEPVVQLSAGDFAFVQLQDIDKAAAAGLSKGQQITASCTGAGEVIGFPSASDCVLK